jgi:NADPH:quinone reductase-like Zn-dependent oxidoreductase
MKAAILREINSEIRIEETDIPQINDGECLVKIKAAALNHRDIWIQKGMYAGIALPCILGSDGAGEIVEIVGNSQFKRGDSVVINPNVDWGSNQNFPQKNYTILGMPTNGTFAEYIKVKSSQIHHKPLHLNWEEAAALPLGGLTAYRALFTKANLQRGENVLITGVGGGVALWAMFLAKAAGANVFVTSGSDEKIEKAKNLGATGGVNYKDETWAKKLKEMCGGFDVIIDSAGGDGFKELVNVSNPGARIAIYGGTAGKINSISPQIIFWKQISILGTSMGSDVDFKEMLNFVNKHQVKMPVNDVFDFEDLSSALDLMSNSNQFGKIVLKLN